MTNFFRSLFGLGGSSKRRVVVGNRVDLDVKDVEYVNESNIRLTTLYNLYKLYKGSLHENKIKLVWEKTKNIHDYLVGKNRLYELELFHLQNTEHFINTFTVIIDVHRQHQGNPLSIPVSHSQTEQKPASPAETLLRAFKADNHRKLEKPGHQTEMVRPAVNGGMFGQAEKTATDVPRLSVPEININTFARLTYTSNSTSGGPADKEIGYTSTPQEKETFLLYIAARMGIRNITYVGNALVNIPNSNGTNPTGMVPIIHWDGFLYAINLNDFRLFPVKVFRKTF
ncbi:hypothetical protein D770_01960 [Flammeovirgaceae bacterium 311]|nr:hypothetical protein D770_01960 [Flammeovirgaceae bacterium 311]